MPLSTHVHFGFTVNGKGFEPAKVQALVERSEQYARTQVAATLGYNLDDRRVLGEKSLLAWAAQPLIRDAVQKCLDERLGLGPQVAAAVTEVKPY